MMELYQSATFTGPHLSKMATTKRKAVTDERSNKKLKSSKQTDKPSQDAKSKDGAATERRAAPKSILQQEERAFPRGGASVLTPLEQKQIRNQAERDVLFEQQTGKPIEPEDPDLFAGDDTAAAPRKSKKQKTRRQSDEVGRKPDKSGIKVHGLSYKNLVVGSVVLGYVTAITSRDVALALANNLTGYVPITAISDTLNGRIERLLRQDEPKNDDAEDEEDVDLEKLFHVGQWLRATVTATGSENSDADGKGKRHIALSLDPRRTNAGLDVGNVVANSMVQAAVRSVEDHGLIMDLGLSDPNVKGFVSKKELGAAYEMDDVQEGQVMMCLVTGKGSNGQVLKLSPDPARFAVTATGKVGPVVSVAPTLDGFQPGTAVDVLVTENIGGIIGKVMGMLDVTADVVHAASRTKDEDLSQKYKIGSKIRGRIIWTLPADEGTRRVGISLQDHLLSMPPPPSRLAEAASTKLRNQATALVNHLPISSIVQDARVVDVRPDRGLSLLLPSISGERGKATAAFAHISQISDSRIESLASSSGPYKIDSTHQARIIAFNPIDNLYYVSLKQSTLDQQFLRLEDVSVGESVKGTVERLVLGAKGVTGALVKLSDNVTGLVPEIHLSDVQLQHPERKFKEGFPVKARVLNVDLNKRQLRLTMKKTLVNDESGEAIWKDYAKLKTGMESKGTIVNLLPSGAAVQFYGNVRAWLPVAEMSETFVSDTKAHFRIGQTIDLRILSVNPESEEMKVSCKSAKVFDEEQQEAWHKISSGQLVSAKVTEKSADSLTVELESGLKGVIRIGHLTDASVERAEKTLKKAQVGQQMTDLVLLQKMERSQAVSLSKKPSLLAAVKAGSLLMDVADAVTAMKVHGFVRNVTPEGVYVEFANNLVGLLPKSQILTESLAQPNFGLRKDQTISAWISHVDTARERFSLSMHEPVEKPKTKNMSTPTLLPVANAADPSIVSLADFQLGKVTKARVASVKATQLNVRLADQVQGRVDFSEAFDAYEEIRNKKAPLLEKFTAGDVIDVKILGVHDARHHRFLPISHRGSSVPVFELSAKKSRIQDGSESGLTMESIKEGSQHLAFVNNHANHGVWVNISPNVRGRIARMELSDDSSQIINPEKHFPIGCALRVAVKHVDAAANMLELSARTDASSEPLTLQNLAPGMIVAGRITKISERALTVQISETLATPVPFTELSDDYDQLHLDQYEKNEIVRVCIMDVDLPNKKLYASLRPSKVLSSSLPVKDSQITSFSQLKVGDVRRGFIRHVAEKGVVISLGSRVDAFVQIRDLSDQFVKDWKTLVEVDKLVKGRVIKVDVDGKHAQMSLKASHLEDDYKAPVTFSDLQVGMTVTGKVRKVEDFGAFVDIDGTQPRLSGLCHRSEIADQRVQDVSKVYSEGDKVKARVLAVDKEKRRISLGLKASYFVDGDESDEEMEDELAGSEEEVDEEEGIDGVELGAFEGLSDVEEDEDSEDDGGVDLEDVQDLESDEDEDGNEDDEQEEVDVDEVTPTSTNGLKTAEFDWSGDAFKPTENGAASDSEPEALVQKKRKRKPEIKEDLTGDLDKYGPRNADDFERQLLGQPNDSSLWIQYMAFQLQLSEIQKARDVAERALRTIHIRETDEKANVWIARLNLEVEYGSEEQVEEVFKQACQVQDPLEMHEKLASIYIDSGKHEKADEMFEKIVANKTFRASPEVWLNYGSFLMDTLKAPPRARALLSRALQSIPTNEHRHLTAKFAALEFRSQQGDTERGRTIFEGLVSEWPKWASGWDMFVDLERAQVAGSSSEEAKKEARERVRAVFQRIAAGKMKKRRAKFVFKKWLEFEKAEGNEKSADRVEALAREWIESQQAKGGDEDMEE